MHPKGAYTSFTAEQAESPGVPGAFAMGSRLALTQGAAGGLLGSSAPGRVRMLALAYPGYQ